MSQKPLTADIDRAAERITDTVLGLGAVAVLMMALMMYLTP